MTPEDIKHIVDALGEVREENHNLRNAIRWIASALHEIARDTGNDYLDKESINKVEELLKHE